MSTHVVHGQAEGVNHHWTTCRIGDVPLPPAYDSPVVIAAVQSLFGADTAEMRIRSARQGAIEVKVEEERPRDAETRQVPETVGYLAFRPFWIRDADNRPIGYATTLDVEQPDTRTWFPLPVPDAFSTEDSIVLAQVLTCHGPNPVHTRIARRHPVSGAPGFLLRLEEWPGYDPWHIGERVGAVVLRKGFHALGSGRGPHLMVAELDDADHTWQALELGNTGAGGRPTVVSQCQTINGADPVATRQREIPDGVELRLQGAGNRVAHPRTEAVGYVAIGNPL